MSDKKFDNKIIVIAILVLLLILTGARVTRLVINLGIFEAELEFPPTATPGLLASATLVSTPTAVPISISPEQAVRDYYALINEGQYGITWSRLSDPFKDKFNCCTPEGHYDFGEYERWWSSVARVDIGETRIIAQSGSTATVFTQLSYVMHNGNRITDDQPYIQLVFDPTTHTWLFSDKGPGP